MLELLAKYAADHEVECEAGFMAKNVRWAILFAEDGQFLSVVELGDTSQKKNPGLKFPKCPHLLQWEMVKGTAEAEDTENSVSRLANTTGKRHFLVDTAEVMTLHSKAADSPEVRRKHRYFVNLLLAAGKVMPQLIVVAEQLNRPDVLRNIRSRLEEQKANPSDSVTFRVGEHFPVESEAWHPWWKDFREALIADEARRLMRCFVTGELVEAYPKHPKVKKLFDIGDSTSGDVLIGFDKDSFCSYGLDHSENASLSADMAWAYCGALNHLIEEHGQSLAGPKVVHWFKEWIRPQDDPLPWLEGDERRDELSAQHRARQLLRSIKTGKRPDLADNYFYALTLSGGGGRVMVRDWMEGEFEDLVRNISAWFDDLEIVNYRGTDSAPTPGIERIVSCLLPPRKPKQRYKDWVKPVGADRIALWRAATRRDPIPYSAVARVVVLDTKFRVTGALENAEKDNDKRKLAEIVPLLHARMGLIKGYHMRKNRKRGGELMPQDLKPYLNEEHPHPAYQCGRLMAVLARLQRKALGRDVVAGVVQRYYSAASSTPGLVFGRLTRTSQHHLGKLKPGLAWWYESRIAGIWSRIKDHVPPTLSLEEQSLFALGYYQEMADMRTKKTDETDNEKEKSNE